MNIGDLVTAARKKKGLYWQKALNLVAGCTPVSEGCLNCWSAAQAHRQSMRQGLSDYQWQLWGGLTDDQGKWTGNIRCLTENLELPKTVKRPTLWSVWNDLFHPDVPEAFQYKFFEMVAECQQHFFLVLTKRPENLLKFHRQCEDYDRSLFPNLAFGVTVELPIYLDRILTLCDVPAALRFVSLEPLLAALSLDHPIIPTINKGYTVSFLKKLSWVIIGCESGRNRRPTKHSWVKLIIEECIANDIEIPVFVKQLSYLPDPFCGNSKIEKAPEIEGMGTFLDFPEVEWKP